MLYLLRKTTWQPCLETFEKDRFPSFSHRYGDATGKPTTRNKTRGCRKTNISYETSSNFHSWQHNKRTNFVPSPIDTARPRENQTRETRQVEAPKRAFRARLPPIFTLYSFKMNIFLRIFLRTWKFVTLKSMFRARFPSIFSTSHKMPRLPRNLHLVATWRSPANAILQKTRNTTRLKCYACHEKWRWTRLKCCAWHENCNISSENVTKVLRLPRKTTFDTFQNTSECHEVPRLPRETKQLRLKTPKRTTSVKLPIGTAIRGSRGRLRTVANGCGRLRTVATTNATSNEHTLSPQTPRVKREPLLRIRE